MAGAPRWRRRSDSSFGRRNSKLIRRERLSLLRIYLLILLIKTTWQVLIELKRGTRVMKH